MQVVKRRFCWASELLITVRWRNLMRLVATSVFGLFLAVTSAGISFGQADKSVKEDLKDAGKAAGDAAKATGEAAGDAAKATGGAAKKTGKKVGNTSKKAVNK